MSASETKVDNPLTKEAPDRMYAKGVSADGKPLLQPGGEPNNSGETEAHLDRKLGKLDLTLIGIGASIGSGIFVLSGTAVANAGPGVCLSFVIAALVCMLDALCYAELASRFPYSGGAYLFAREAFGARTALVVGMNLLFDYHIGAAAIARSFAGYLYNMVNSWEDDDKTGHWIEEIPISGILSGNVIAPVLLILLTIVLYRGVTESATLNRVLTSAKILTILVVILAGCTRLDTSLWTPFMPKGIDAVIAESATLFFAYVGFDAVANSAEECSNPAADIPAGICISLAACAALYVGVVIVLAGLVYYKDIDQDSPLSSAFEDKHGMKWARDIVDIGGLIGLTTTLLIGLYAQARVYLGIARDGMLPSFLAKVHPKFHSPGMAQLCCGIIAIVLATFFNVHMLAELLSIGVMTSYTSVCAAVLYLRTNNPTIAARSLLFSTLCSLAFSICLRVDAPLPLTVILGVFLLLSALPFIKSMAFTEPDISTTFACPYVPWIPWIGMCCNLGLMVQLPVAAWIRFGVVTVLTLMYFEYKKGDHDNVMMVPTADHL